jgi:hypothetical protein
MHFEITWLALLACGVASMIIGSFWYSPLGLGKPWMKEMGLTKEDVEKGKEKGMVKEYVLMFVGSLVVAFVLSQSVEAWESATVISGMLVGFWTWLGFIAPVMLGTVLWEEKSWKLYGINVVYWLVNLIVMGIILSVWPW